MVILGRGLHAAATVVPAHDDVLDLQGADGVLHDALAIEVAVDHDVRDVAVDEYLAGLEADDLIGGDAAVGAADPEDLGPLPLGQVVEEIGVFLEHALGPGAIVLEQVWQESHGVILRERDGSWLGLLL